MTVTTVSPVPDFLKILAHDLRWQLLSTLTESDRRVQELVETLQRPQNLISYHLRQLRTHHLVHERRSSADARDVYYSLDLAQLQRLYQDSGEALHPALTSDKAQPQPENLSPESPPTGCSSFAPTTAPAPNWPKAFCGRKGGQVFRFLVLGVNRMG